VICRGWGQCFEFLSVLLHRRLAAQWIPIVANFLFGKKCRKKIQGTTGQPRFNWKTRISCHWHTRMMCYITGNMQQTNKADAQCDTLATELSLQRFASNVANFQLPHLHLTYPTCIWRLRWRWRWLSFAEIFSNRKLESLDYCVALFVWSYD